VRWRKRAQRSSVWDVILKDQSRVAGSAIPLDRSNVGRPFISGAVRALVDEFTSKYDRLHVLVNNAGAFTRPIAKA
jgi:NAD(P)-dependent dehydrogenase (short-subunit alcohol dehydrogenase family)